MIRIHQVWSELELEGCHKFVDDFFQENVFENMEWTLEHAQTPQDECDRLRSSANYILFVLNNHGVSHSTCVDLTYNLATRPKRVVVVITNENDDPGLYVQDSLRGVLSQLSRLYPSNGFQVLNNLTDLKAFLETFNQSKTSEAT